MRRQSPPRPVRVALTYVPLLLLAFVLPSAVSCGGGGGGGGTTGPDVPSRALLGIFRADLTGANEVDVKDADATGTFLCALYDDGSLEFASAVEPEWADLVNDAHIHVGPANLPGPIFVDLIHGENVFDPATGFGEDELAADVDRAAKLAEIAANPGEYYVNIHTEVAPDGFVRGQLAPLEPVEFYAILRGREEKTVVDAGARAAAAVTVGPDLMADTILAAGTPPIADITAAQVHTGAAGVDGAPLVDLDLASATRDDALGTRTGRVPVSMAALVRLLQDPEGFFVRIHTAAAPNGLARGQVRRGPVDLWATMRGDEEVAVVDADARGATIIRFDSFTSGDMMLAVPPDANIEEVTAAHVHEGGPAPVAGPPVIDLMAGPDFENSAITSTSGGSISLDAVLFARILANPGGFYANAHTANAVDGLVRGQLSDEPLTFTASMSGGEEATVVDPDAFGAVRIVCDRNYFCSFTITMTQPDAADVTNAHVHEGASGVSGPPLLPLFEGEHAVTGSTITGATAFPGRILARMIAAPEFYYVNVHSDAAPAGVARGQLVRVTADTPPTSVIYDDPFVFETGLRTDGNVPVSFGGAVTVYSVSPALPSGLLIHALTGEIYGTPSAATPAANYVIRAANAAGNATTTVNITVVASIPKGLSYQTPVDYPVGFAISPNAPTSTGGTITSYTVSPSLPAGLKIDSSTGVISGTPSSVTAAADYTVTGANNSGSTTAVVNIKVSAVLQPPANLSYSSSTVSYQTGAEITPNQPTVGGGPVSSWSVSPSLPSGLFLDNTNGEIRGTPTATAGAADYTITAQNSAGSTTAKVNITVTEGAPTSLSYTNNGQYVSLSKKGSVFSTMSPSWSGGKPTKWSVSPSLPSGITLNSDGTISGFPKTSGTYSGTVTAENSAGKATASVIIYVTP